MCRELSMVFLSRRVHVVIMQSVRNAVFKPFMNVRKKESTDNIAQTYEAIAMIDKEALNDY